MSKVFKDAKVIIEPFPALSEPSRSGVTPFVWPVVGEDGELVPPSPSPAVATAPEEPDASFNEVDVEALIEEARRQGFAAGEKQGTATAKARFDEKLAELGSVVRQTASYKAALRSGAEQEVVELAFEIARKILRRELTIDPKTALALVRSTVQERNSADPRRIRVRPEDVELLRAAVGPEVEVVGDSSVTAGGAILETEQGRLDARIETQLDEIERGLADR